MKPEAHIIAMLFIMQPSLIQLVQAAGASTSFGHHGPGACMSWSLSGRGRSPRRAETRAMCLTAEVCYEHVCGVAGLLRPA